MRPNHNMGKRLTQNIAPRKIRNDSVDMNLKKSFANERDPSGSLNEDETEIFVDPMQNQNLRVSKN